MGGLVRFLMSPLALLLLPIYYAGTMLDRMSFYWGWRKSQRLPGRTISVGNISVGGTGKSPVVVEIAKILLEHGAHPAILTRGYKSGLDGQQWALFHGGLINVFKIGQISCHIDHTSHHNHLENPTGSALVNHSDNRVACSDAGLGATEYTEINEGTQGRQHKANQRSVISGFERKSASLDIPLYADEARMQSEALPSVPVIVGVNRMLAAEEFLRVTGIKPTHWIIDDGLQHWKIQRDCEIILLDYKRPFSDGFLLPFGRLRERVSALRRADLVMFTRAGVEPVSSKKINRVRRYFAGPVLTVPFSNRPLELATGGALAAVSAPDTTSVHRAEKKALLMVGISDPTDLITRIQSSGVRIYDKYIVLDHRRFNASRAKEKIAGCDFVITTAKDYWRDPTFFSNLPVPTYILPLEAHLGQFDVGILLG